VAARDGTGGLKGASSSRRTAVVRHPTGVEELPGLETVVVGRQLG
jgi:hypothetical protein